MLEVLTPLSKLHRISRKIYDRDNFDAAPGIWVSVRDDGSVANLALNTPSINCSMIISSANDNKYESHDVRGVGNVSNIAEPGVRCRVDEDCYVDSVNVAIGLDLMVSVDTGNIGKLAVLADITRAGDYAVVARVSEFDATKDILTFETVSPRTITKS